MIPDVLQRLRQRKLVQWALAYLASAWLLLQVGDLLADAYDWSPGIMRTMPVVLAFGLLALLVIAWNHGEKGRQRVTGLELILLAAICAVAGVVVARVQAGDATEDVPDAGAPAHVNPRSVVVLPFVNTSGDPEQEYFSDGISDEIRDALAQVPGLHVPARTSSYYFKGKNLRVRDVGEQLGVASVLEGSVQRIGEKVRIYASLADARTDRTIWRQTFEPTRGDVFAIQTEIARTVAAALKIQLRADSAAMATAPTQSAAAHDLYLQGLFHWNRRTGLDLRRAQQLFEEASRIDPNYARAHAGIALVYAVLPIYGRDMPPTEAIPFVERAARRALALDSSLAEPHAALAYAYHWVWRWDDAGREFARAIALNPSHTTTRQWYGEYLAKIGRGDEGVAELKRAVQLDPLSLTANGNYCVVLNIARREADAIAQCERTHRMDPSFAFPLNMLHKLYLRNGRRADALQAARKWAELGGMLDPQDIQTLVEAVADSSRRGGALDILARLERVSVPLWTDIAFYYLMLGEHERALTALERGYEARSPLMTGVAASPLYDGLRDEPRFQRVVRGMGL